MQHRPASAPRSPRAPRTALLIPLLNAFTFTLAPSLSSQTPAPPDAATLKPPPQHTLPGYQSITSDVCREWLTVLASDDMGGRATGTEGYEKAARYVAARFKEFNLKPMGDMRGAEGAEALERYFQKVPFGEVLANPAESHFAIHDSTDKEVTRVAFGEGIGGFVNANADRAYGIVFIRASTQQELDDLVAKAGGHAAVTEGKATFLLDRSAATSRPGSGAAPAQRPARPLSLNPGRRDASQPQARPGILIRVDDRQAASTAGLPRYLGPRRGVTFNAPTLNRYAVTTDAAKKLLTSAGISDTDLDGEQPVLASGGEARLVVKVQTMEKPAFAVNVIGLLEGSDHETNGEIVGIGSHLDHIGTGANGQVNNGADDDASGTTGVLAVARAMSLNPVKPKRSILFMCFCAEELGLQGSLYYSLKPVIPNSRMVAELQMDMIGRNEESRTEKAEDNLNTLHLIGTRKLSEELHEICLSANRDHVGFEFEFDEEDVFSRSDHVNFAKEDIPIAFFFTGFHPQYHRHDDEVDLIDFEKLARVAKLAYLIAFDVANRDARVKVDRRFADIPAEEGGGGPRRPRSRPASASRPASQPVR